MTQEREKPPIEAGKTFSPEEELEKAKRAPKKERQARVEAFKEKLAFQKEGLAEMQTQLIDIIRENPDIEPRTLYGYVDALGSKFGITQQQRMFSKEIVEEYVARHRAVQALRKKFPDDAALYQAAFKRAPKGKIEVIEGPMTLHFRCHDPEDYVFVQSFAFFYGRAVTPEDITKSNRMSAITILRHWIPEFEGALIAENTSNVKGEEKAREVLVHEEQHSIRSLFRERTLAKVTAYELMQSKDDRERMQITLRYLRATRQTSIEPSAKDEILAYFKGGRSPKEIYDELLIPKEQGGAYDFSAHAMRSSADFLTKTLDAEKRPLFKRMIQAAAKKVFETEYYALLEQGIDAFAILRNNGYSQDQVIAILMQEPLHRWDKAVQRLLEAKR